MIIRLLICLSVLFSLANQGCKSSYRITSNSFSGPFLYSTNVSDSTKTDIKSDKNLTDSLNRLVFPMLQEKKASLISKMDYRIDSSGFLLDSGLKASDTVIVESIPGEPDSLVTLEDSIPIDRDTISAFEDSKDSISIVVLEDSVSMDTIPVVNSEGVDSLSISDSLIVTRTDTVFPEINKKEKPSIDTSDLVKLTDSVPIISPDTLSSSDLSETIFEKADSVLSIADTVGNIQVKEEAISDSILQAGDTISKILPPDSSIYVEKKMEDSLVRPAAAVEMDTTPNIADSTAEVSVVPEESDEQEVKEDSVSVIQSLEEVSPVGIDTIQQVEKAIGEAEKIDTIQETESIEEEVMQSAVDDSIETKTKVIRSDPPQSKTDSLNIDDEVVEAEEQDEDLEDEEQSSTTAVEGIKEDSVSKSQPVKEEKELTGKQGEEETPLVVEIEDSMKSKTDSASIAQPIEDETEADVQTDEDVVQEQLIGKTDTLVIDQPVEDETDDVVDVEVNPTIEVVEEQIKDKTDTVFIIQRVEDEIDDQEDEDDSQTSAVVEEQTKGKTDTVFIVQRMEDETDDQEDENDSQTITVVEDQKQDQPETAIEDQPVEEETSQEVKLDRDAILDTTIKGDGASQKEDIAESEIRISIPDTSNIRLKTKVKKDVPVRSGDTYNYYYTNKKGDSNREWKRRFRDTRVIIVPNTKFVYIDTSTRRPASAELSVSDSVISKTGADTALEVPDSFITVYSDTLSDSLLAGPQDTMYLSLDSLYNLYKFSDSVLSQIDFLIARIDSMLYRMGFISLVTDTASSPDSLSTKVDSSLYIADSIPEEDPIVQSKTDSNVQKQDDQIDIQKESVKSEVKLKFRKPVLQIFYKSMESVYSDVYNNELLKIASALKENPNVTLEVTGFTDASGNTSLNKQLARSRANEVIDFLKEQGVEEKQLKITTPSDLKEQQSLNESWYMRRVDLKYVK